MEIPSLSHTFRSANFIIPEAIQGKDREISVDEAFGSLSIDMVEVGDQKASNIGLPPFSRGKFWKTGPLLNFSLSLNFQTSNDHEQPDVFA